MTTRDSVLGEYFGVASDCVERNGAIAAMADEIVRLRKIEAAAKQALAFFRSVILSGEQWTSDCERVYRNTLTPEAPTDG